MRINWVLSVYARLLFDPCRDHVRLRSATVRASIEAQKDQETTTCCDERPFSSKRCGGNQTQRPRSGPAAPSLPSKVLCNYNWVMDDE
uniref:Uncharacterized protein n=1 Tax=Daphnia galeata TaxID=27404 RepID=A0A8J2WHW0_9CRUS|nr:unnamed protein product [Daphnia galeata]